MNTKSPFLIVLLALALVIAFVFYEGVQQLTVFSVSKIEIEPEGYVEGNQLKGTFWSITLITDFTEGGWFTTYDFDDEEAHGEKANPVDPESGQNMTVKNQIKIMVVPQQPYYSRKLTLASSPIAPHAYQNWFSRLGMGDGRDKGVKVEGLDSNHSVFAESDWTAHTPFLVRAYVNGELFAEEVIDTVGATKTVTLGTDPNIITVSKLGLIGTGYEAPVWQDIIWWNHQHFYLRDGAIDKALTSPYPRGTEGAEGRGTISPEQLRGTYAFYWYGQESGGDIWGDYWKDEGDPFPGTGVTGGTRWLNREQSGGWTSGGDDSLYIRYKPVAPVLFPEQEDAYHSPYYSVTEYLERTIGAKRPTMPSWLPNAADIVITENGEMRLYLPFGSLNALVNLRVSTELADTYVWSPALGNFQITDFQDFGDVYEEKQWTIKVKQLEETEASMSGTIWFTVSPSTLQVAVNPPTIGVQLGYNEEQTYTFNIVNLAVQQETSFSITAKVTNSLGQVTDTAVAEGTAKPRSGTVTYLVVYLIDYKDRIPVTGVYVTVTYDSQSKTVVSQDGTAVFDFGSTAPYVQIVTQETFTYQSASASKQLQPGSNTVTLELLKQGEQRPEDWLWLVVVAGILAASVITVFTVKKKVKI